MNGADKYKEILHQYWGYDDFRGIQRDIIESIGSGKDTLGLMPTGGGKSITFQVPALSMPGTCIVITPLIALMKDQVKALRDLGIKATAIFSGQSREENIIALDNCILGGYKFLYVSPERLSSDIFLTKLRHLRISFITVDEAHCICQWGYDFRPSYLQIAEIRKEKPEVPVLALTATATPKVAKDIQKQLLFRKENVIRMSFERNNLAYFIYKTDLRYNGICRILNSIPGSSIIYTRNRQNCQDLSEQLNKEGFSSTFYHAGLQNSIKDERQSKWLRGEIRIMVATNAFGMGINKPDVRTVIHMDVPDSLEEYFQEAGRAGRDGQKSYAIMVMDGKEMQSFSRRLTQRFPEKETVKKLYQNACDYLQIAVGDGLNVTREFNLEEFCRIFHFHPIMARSALTLLDKAGYIEYADAEEGSSRLKIIATRNDLYRIVNGQEESIINSLLRHYGGIFINYIYLDESLICKETGLDMETIYHVLTGMNKKGILQYIPRKKIPLVTFKMKRVETEKIVLPREVYDDQRQNYADRLHAIKKYCTLETICRSKLLLNYFGEDQTHNCGICDVCQREKAYHISEDEFHAIRQHIINQLKDGPKKAFNINTNGINQYKLRQVIDYMRAKEEITMTNQDISLT